MPSLQGQPPGASKVCQQPALVLPELVAGGRPVLADHLDDALAAVELDARHAVALDGEAGGDHRVAGVAEVEQEVGVVVRSDLDQLAVDDALGDGGAGHGHHALGRADDAGEGGDVVDAEVEHGAAARLVEPLPPVGTGPAVEAAGGEDRADIALVDAAPDRLVGRAEDDVRGADQVAGAALGQADQLRGFRQGHRHRLLDQDVLARLQRGAGDLAVLLHRGEDEHQLDRRVVQDLAVVGGEVVDRVALAGVVPARRVGVADDLDVDALARHVHVLHLRDVLLRHAAGADHPDADWCHDGCPSP